MAKRVDKPRPLIPMNATLEELRQAAKNCKACDLWRTGTQTVFGEGAENSRVVLVGEQPGDKEDREGRPFVGPAGRELDKALVAAGIDRREVYVTNVVKHFKFEERGARRLHATPKKFEVDACRPWLDAELRVVKPLRWLCWAPRRGRRCSGASSRSAMRAGGLWSPTWRRS